jgi:hypothetical protein
MEDGWTIKTADLSLTPLFSATSFRKSTLQAIWMSVRSIDIHKLARTHPSILLVN